MNHGKKIVLIVDDTPVNLEILIEALSDEYTVRVATDGMAALANVRQSPPDAILLDVMMPGLDGFEVCRKLKADPATRDIPVIFLTALTDFTGEGWGLGLGAVDYIYKPFNPEIVKARLRIQLELMEYRNDLKRLVKTRTSELEEARRAAIAGMAFLAEFRDTETGGHIIRTREYMHCLAEELAGKGGAFEFWSVDLLSESATLHDIGKVGIPDSILLKPSALTPSEFAVIKTHTLIGSQIIERLMALTGGNSFLIYAQEIVRSHHEKYDGSGYPDGLSGDAIPPSAQLMSIVDIYDALSCKRIYKPAFSHRETTRIILEGDGRVEPGHFNPIVLEAFVAVSDRFREIASRFAE